MTLTDEQIIRRVQGGQRDEYLLLFDRYYACVERYAQLRMGGDLEAARDLASETFLRAYRHIDRFVLMQNTSYAAYLLMICRRLIISERERLARAPQMVGDDAPEMRDYAASSAELPLERILDDERRDAIRHALTLLPPADREIVHLAYERDLSRRDIMEITEKPSLSAVTSHLHRALLRLKAIVQHSGYFVECEPEPRKRS